MNESWMLPKEAMEFILEHVEPGSVVVEFGSGHGTEVLSKHFDLYSFEHDEAWMVRALSLTYQTHQVPLKIPLKQIVLIFTLFRRLASKKYAYLCSSEQSVCIFSVCIFVG